MKATQIRKGQILKIDETLYKVMVMDHVTPGKGRAHVQTKLRSIMDGTQTDKRFRSDEDVEKVFIDTQNMQYLYGDGDGSDLRVSGQRASRRRSACSAPTTRPAPRWNWRRRRGVCARRGWRPGAIRVAITCRRPPSPVACARTWP